MTGLANGNAQCERQNRTIIDYLKKQLEGETLEWEEKIATCQFAYNSQVHKSTKYSPYFLRHAMEPAIPIKPPQMGRSYYENWTTEAIRKLKETWEEVYKNLNDAKKSQKYQHDKKVNPRKFKAGDLVYVKTTAMKPGENQKLIQTWKGPYMIQRMIGEETAQLEVPRKRSIRSHVNNLKRYYTDEEEDSNYHLDAPRTGRTPGLKDVVVPPPVSRWKKIRDPTPPRQREPEEEEETEQDQNRAEQPEVPDETPQEQEQMEAKEQTEAPKKNKVTFNIPRMPSLRRNEEKGTEITTTKEPQKKPGPVSMNLPRMTRSRGKAPDIETPNRPIEWKALKDFANKNKS